MCLRNEEYLGKVSLTNPIAVEDDTLRFARRSLCDGSMEFEEELIDDVLHLLNEVVL